jgi:type IV pilus assembly protein PilV
VLVEAMVAIVIFSVGVLAVVGLQASMLKNTSDSKYRAEASFIAQQRVGMMWADMSGTYAGTFVEATPTSIPELPNGFRTTTQTLLLSGNGVDAKITITWQLPGEVQHNYTTTAAIYQNP